MSTELDKKIDRAVRLIRSTVGDKVVEVSYSGGKDSDVILELTKMSGVKYRAIYKNTTIDPKGTIQHCRENGVEIRNPKTPFYKLVEKKGIPSRFARFCCSELKEYKVLDIAIQGIRRCESTARAKRYKSSDPVICRNYNKEYHVNVILPILDWSDDDVLAFIYQRKIKLHPLYYDKHGKIVVQRRLGCIGCPLAIKDAVQDFKENPRHLKALIRAAQRFWDSHPNSDTRKRFNSVYEIFVQRYFFDDYNKFMTSIYGSVNVVDCKAAMEEFFNVKFD